VKNGDLVFPEPVLSRGMPAGALVAVGVVVAIGAYVAWFNWSGSGNRVVDAVPPVPPRLEQAAQEGQRLREGAPPAAPTQAAAAANPTAAAPATPAPAPAAAPPPPAGDGPRVALRARGEAWIQIRDTRANTVLTDRVLRGNETFPVPNRDGLVLTTGKAENLDVLLDGQVTPALAGATGVRRGIVLDIERLRADAAGRPAAPAPGTQAAAPAAPRPASATTPTTPPGTAGAPSPQAAPAPQAAPGARPAPAAAALPATPAAGGPAPTRPPAAPGTAPAPNPPARP
jgi:cytoskeleton protein RodZ